jgi:trans-aconitate methyltransferase
MSRLDSFIRRLIAQRDILNFVATDLELPRDGAVLELGLGNGRTYSHLRELFPARRIIAFDRALVAHAASAPPARDLVLGEIRDTAAAFAGRAAARREGA